MSGSGGEKTFPSGDGQVFAPGIVVAKRYRLDRLLGEGGMGVVWAATHTVTRRSVAMKFLRGESHRHSPELRHRFLREARAASAVQHPNVVTISDVFELDDETPVMVMDLLVGETLGQKLVRESKLTLEQTLAILLPVISAVGSAHALGVIHRDLKPDNIFIVEGAAPGEGVRVLDFGIAKLLEPDEDGSDTGIITNTGAILGTPCYMSPEQALAEHDIDHRTDIWSLGVILYECLAGRRPIQGDNIGQIVKQIVVDGVRPIDEHESDLPIAVVGLVGRMLSRERSARPQNLGHVVKLLGDYTPVAVPSFGLPEPTSGWLSDTEQGTPVDRKSAWPPGRAVPRFDTAGPQSLVNGVQHRPRRSMFTLAIAAGAVMLAGIAIWQGRTHANKSAAPPPIAPAVSSPAPSIGSAVEPPLAASSTSSPSSEPKLPAAPTTPKRPVRSTLAPPLSSVPSPAASSPVIVATPSAVPPNRPPGGLSEKVPF